MATGTYQVTGMTCSHCVSAVTEELSQLDGVTDVAVDLETGRATVTSDEPFAYQAYATIETGGASAVDFDFEVEVESGGVTVGLLQGGKWIAVNSSDKPGSFKGANSARLAYRRSTTVMIANDNPSGASRLTLKSLRLFLRK